MCRHELLIRWSMQPFQLVPFLRLVDCTARLVFLFPLPSITHLLYAVILQVYWGFPVLFNHYTLSILGWQWSSPAR
jgi:hypothetical protein